MKSLVHGFQSRGSKLCLKSLFTKEIGPGTLAYISNSSLNLWSLGCMDHWFLCFKSFPTISGTPKSDERIKSYGRSKFQKMSIRRLAAWMPTFSCFSGILTIAWVTNRLVTAQAAFRTQNGSVLKEFQLQFISTLPKAPKTFLRSLNDQFEPPFAPMVHFFSTHYRSNSMKMAELTYKRL